MKNIIATMFLTFSIGCAGSNISWVHIRQLNPTDPGPTADEFKAAHKDCNDIVKKIFSVQAVPNPLFPSLMFAFCMEKKGYRLLEIVPVPENAPKADAGSSTSAVVSRK